MVRDVHAGWERSIVLKQESVVMPTDLLILSQGLSGSGDWHSCSSPRHTLGAIMLELFLQDESQNNNSYSKISHKVGSELSLLCFIHFNMFFSTLHILLVIHIYIYWHEHDLSQIRLLNKTRFDNVVIFRDALVTIVNWCNITWQLQPTGLCYEWYV